MNDSNFSIQLRKSQPGDELAIAAVHIQSWQETYKGLVPQDYLDQLPLELPERIKNWTKTLLNPNRHTWVAENRQGVLGFILFGPPRDSGKEKFVELGALYLLASHQGKGIGAALLSIGFRHLKALDYQRAYCWVLENNPSIRFYEKTGAVFSGEIKEDEIGGQKCNELAYSWKELSFAKIR